MIDTSGINDYIKRVQKSLGHAWLVEADNTDIGPFHTVGSIAKAHTLHCFMMTITPADCARRIKSAFPEKDNG